MISIDEAILHCEEVAEKCSGSQCGTDHRQLAEWLKELKRLKTSADTVPVVRCKDCRFADAYYHCVYTNFWESAEDYCSRGERKTNG